MLASIPGLGISEADRAAILGGNAERPLGIRGAARDSSPMRPTLDMRGNGGGEMNADRRNETRRAAEP